jgi:Uncharacterized alpha/beta hydrolase domain (DUF2235)
LSSSQTGQDGGVRPEQTMSNVYKLYRACRVGPENAVNPREQVAFYDPGLGTDIGATALTAPVRFVQKMLASVTGRGITTNIADCYEFIINQFEPGDRIFLIGFSRGAYTVRCVANLLMLCGIPTATDFGPIPKFRKGTRDIAEEAVFEVFEHGAGRPRSEFQDERFEKARRFRHKYTSESRDGGDASNAAPHFVGVFDTVATLGARGMRRVLIGVGLAGAGAIVVATVAVVMHLLTGVVFWLAFVSIGVVALFYGLWKWLVPGFKTIRDYPKKGDFRWHFAMWKAANYDRLLSGHVGYAKSANAIDETRADFDRVGWGSAGTVRPRVGQEPQPLIQIWFAGNHSDVGGSYPEVESRLSDIALMWMTEQAVGIPNGLKIGPVIVNGIKMPGTGDRGEPLSLFLFCDGVQHCEITGMQDTIDRRTPRFLRWLTSYLNWKEKVRKIKPDALVHDTVKQRFALPSVVQCASSGSYRPPALANHPEFMAFYPHPVEESTSAPPGT